MKKMNNQRLAAGFGVLALVGISSAWYSPRPAGVGFVINELPATISTSGTYVLTGDLVAGEADEGISVVVPNVIIDLRGHRLVGAGAKNGHSGIVATGDFVTVRNGTVEQWGGNGVRLRDYARVYDLNVRDNVKRGVTTGELSHVERCQFNGNLEGDINLLGNGVVADCFAKGVTGSVSVAVGENCDVQRVHVRGSKNALVAGGLSRVKDCTVIGFEEIGILIGNGASASDCAVRSFLSSGKVGISGGLRSRIRDCHVEGYLVSGIRVSDESSIWRSTVYQARESGISMGDQCRVVECLISENNKDENAQRAGLEGGLDSWVERSFLTRNYGSGIRVLEGGASITQCVSTRNIGTGVLVGDGAHVIESQVHKNFGAGVIVLGDRGRIEGNSIDDNQGDGLSVRGSLNLVVDNRASTNQGADFDLPWGNPYGPLLNTIGQIVGSIPQANFESN